MLLFSESKEWAADFGGYRNNLRKILPRVTIPDGWKPLIGRLSPGPPAVAGLLLTVRRRALLLLQGGRN